MGEVHVIELHIEPSYDWFHLAILVRPDPDQCAARDRNLPGVFHALRWFVSADSQRSNDY